MQKDEIKEILEDIKGIYYFKPLLDYITNLQEENERLKNTLNLRTEIATYMQNKIEKALEYAKTHRTTFDINKFINILQGKSDE